jgi:hypothetical protein
MPTGNPIAKAIAHLFTYEGQMPIYHPLSARKLN